jgi:Xaa-Pro aminopeptidase
MRFARPGRMEYEVMAEILHEFRSHNADLSYPPSSAAAPMPA